MSTFIYSIETPIVLGSENSWGDILNNQTFTSLDLYMRDNPASYVAINASGTTASGQIRLFNNINLYNNFWAITHNQNSEDNILSIRKNQTLSTPLIFISGGAWHKSQNISPFTSYGPGGLIYLRGKITGEGMFDGIGDWISSSTVDWTDVDVSDDGVPKGAIAVILCNAMLSSETNITCYFRKNGDSNTDGTAILSTTFASIGITNVLLVPIDSNGIFEAKFSSSWTSSINSASVMGYLL